MIINEYNNINNVITSISFFILGIILYIKKKDFISISIIFVGIMSILNHTNESSQWWIYDLDHKSQIPINNSFVIRILDYWCIITLFLLYLIKYGYKLFFWIVNLIIYILFSLPKILNLDRKKYILTHNLIHIIVLISIIYFEFY